MKKVLKQIVSEAVFGAAIVLLAAGFVTDRAEAGIEASPATDTTVVAVEVGPEGFDPGELILENDRPARLVFTRTVEATCAKKIHIPEFGIEATSLPLNEPIAFEVHPTEGGTFTFACAMDMMKGSILVRPE